MNRLIVLDTGVLGMLIHPRENRDLGDWLAGRASQVCIAEISDYELRRKLIQIESRASISRLDELEGELRYIPISTRMMRRAAKLWAEARREGHVTAPPEAIDGDVILAAQSLVFAESSATNAVVATDNVGHLGFFVDARPWDEI